MKALSLSRYEMETITAEQRIITALRFKQPSASRYKLSPGDLVLVYREKDRKWVDPVEIVKVERKLTYVTDGVSVKTISYGTGHAG